MAETEPLRPHRLEHVRQVVDLILSKQKDAEERRHGYLHLYGVSGLCVLLALRRGLDAELAGIAGMLHDICTYESGYTKDHGELGAARAREILARLGEFSEEEIEQVAEAIITHSKKRKIHGPLAEVLKDADALQFYVYNPALQEWDESKPRVQRLKAMFVELGIPAR